MALLAGGAKLMQHTHVDPFLGFDEAKQMERVCGRYAFSHWV
jgi:hypothetical protein